MISIQMKLNKQELKKKNNSQFFLNECYVLKSILLLLHIIIFVIKTLFIFYLGYSELMLLKKEKKIFSKAGDRFQHFQFKIEHYNAFVTIHQ